MGNLNHMYEYKMFVKSPLQVAEEKDIELVIGTDLQHTKQCLNASNTGNRTFRFIARHFPRKTPETIQSLYKTLVRPHLDYAGQSGSPNYEKDEDKLESPETSHQINTGAAIPVTPGKT